MTDNFSNTFYNAETELNLNYDNEIIIHKQLRGSKKCDTIIQGLIFNTKEENKEFISKIKRKLGIGGCQKMIEDVDKKNLVFIFTGDYRDKIKDILIQEYGKIDEFIKYQG